MPNHAGLTLAEARARFLVKQGLAPDGGYTAPWWAMTFGGLNVPVPNFRWRRRAVPLHDLHHIITGYECNPAGEMQIAAWEFAAGRFPHPLATLFCLPLVGLGAIFLPRRTFAAFVRGRRSTTFYLVADTDRLLGARVEALRREFLPAGQPEPSLRDRLAYAVLVATSLGLMLSPCAAGLAIVRLL